MRSPRLIAIPLALAGMAFHASAQMYPSIIELGRTADLVAFATVVQATATPGAPPNTTLTVELRLDRVIKGQPAPQTVQAAIAETCYSGGSGPMHLCVRNPSRMAGMSGLWFLKSGASGYEIQPRRVGTYDPEEIFLPIPIPPGTKARPSIADLDNLMLAYQVQWIQSLTDPPVHDDERFFSPFESRVSPDPSRQQVVAAIKPLITSSSPWQHAVGLVIALRADSADAMAQVVNELPALQSNPRFSEIIFAIGAYPIQGGAGSKDPGWIAPLRQLLARHTDIPGMDAAAAGALYRIGTRETWPLIASLLDSKDSYAQVIAVRTIAMRVPAALATEQTGQYYPGAMGQHFTTQEYAAFWKSWWNSNRASLGFPD